MAVPGAVAGLAVNNFGTGYSSLSSLERFPLDYLNIERSLVEKLKQDTGQDGLRYDHARPFSGHKVVAEGVETAGRLARLEKLGCDLAQGYHFSKPLPADEAKPFLVGLAA